MEIGVVGVAVQGSCPLDVGGELVPLQQLRPASQHPLQHRPDVRGVAGAGQRDGRVDPGEHLVDRRLVQARRRERGEQSEREPGVAGGEGPAVGRSQVVELGGDPVGPDRFVDAPQTLRRLFHEAGVVLGVAAATVVGLARGVELLPGELADRLEQAVAGGAVGRVGDDQRLGDQAAEQVVDVDHVEVVVGGHRLGGVEGERAGEHRQPAEHPPLPVVEQVVGPRHRRPQRLLAPDRPSPADEQPEPFVEPGRDLGGLHRPQPGGRHLHGERDAVEPAADLPGRVVGHEGRLDGPGPLDEQLHGLVAAERPHRVGDLAVDAERFPAGGQHPQLRAAPAKSVGQVGGRVEQVLAVVEHQHDPLGGEVRGERVDRAAGPAPARFRTPRRPRRPPRPGRRAGPARTTTPRRDGRAGPRPPTSRARRVLPTPPGPVSVRTRDIGRARAELPHLPAAADEARQHGRQVAERAVERPHGREPVGQVAVGHLPQRDRLGQVPQAVLAQAAEADALGDPVPGQLDRRLRAEDLAAPPGRHDPGRPVQRRTEVVAADLDRLARVQAHPHRDRLAPPRLERQGC